MRVPYAYRNRQHTLYQSLRPHCLTTASLPAHVLLHMSEHMPTYMPTHFFLHTCIYTCLYTHVHSHVYSHVYTHRRWHGAALPALTSSRALQQCCDARPICVPVRTPMRLPIHIHTSVHTSAHLSARMPTHKHTHTCPFACCRQHVLCQVHGHTAQGLLLAAHRHLDRRGRAPLINFTFSDACKPRGSREPQ